MKDVRIITCIVTFYIPTAPACCQCLSMQNHLLAGCNMWGQDTLEHFYSPEFV